MSRMTDRHHSSDRSSQIVNHRLIVAFLFLLVAGSNAFQVSRITPRLLLPMDSSLPRSKHSKLARSLDVVSPPHIVEETRLQKAQASRISVDQPKVPTTMKEAAATFLFSGDCGPLYVIMSILAFMSWRAQLSSLELADGVVFAVTVLFWSFQEHFLHEKVLHSKMDWIGKDIHQGHHEKPYHHVSLDPAPLLLGWMFTAHFALRAVLPLPLALSATVAYSLSGLFYEWAHYIVHTKVRFHSKFWKRVKENHLRHHVVSDEYWFAFSMPFMDDIFGTNPPVRQVRQQVVRERRAEE